MFKASVTSINWCVKAKDRDGWWRILGVAKAYLRVLCHWCCCCWWWRWFVKI